MGRLAVMGCAASGEEEGKDSKVIVKEGKGKKGDKKGDAKGKDDAKSPKGKGKKNEPEPASPKKSANKLPDGSTLAHVLIGPEHKVCLPVKPDITLQQIIDHVTKTLEDYDEWTQTNSTIYTLSSKWHLSEHLEYCASDPLDDIEGYTEHESKDELHFLALIKESITFDTYDNVSEDAFSKDSDYWEGESRHVVKLTDAWWGK